MVAHVSSKPNSIVIFLSVVRLREIFSTFPFPLHRLFSMKISANVKMLFFLSDQILKCKIENKRVSMDFSPKQKYLKTKKAHELGD